MATQVTTDPWNSTSQTGTVSVLRPGAQHPLRVLFLNYEFPPMGGGAGNATKCTSIELVRRGHLGHVLTSRLPAQPSVEVVDGVVVCRVRSMRHSLHECGLLGAASYIFFAFFELRRLARTYQYDVYHFYFGLPTAILALYVHFILRKPYIIALRGSDVPGYDNTKWYMRPLHMVLRPISRFLWRKASSMTVLSENLQNLARTTDPKLDASIISNGISSERFPCRPPEHRKKDVRLICVCRLVQRKGLEYLIEAMRELKNDGVTLELIGSGQDEARIAGLIREYGLQAHVRMVGYVAAEHLYEHYHRADIFVLPSLSESFGQVLLEAMSCGLPVVATAIGGIPETIRHSRNGILVPPRDVAALTAAIRRLASNPKMQLRMGRLNAKLARERYDWSAVASRYVELYYRATGSSPDADQTHQCA